MRRVAAAAAVAATVCYSFDNIDPTAEQTPPPVWQPAVSSAPLRSHLQTSRVNKRNSAKIRGGLPEGGRMGSKKPNLKNAARARENKVKTRIGALVAL